MKDAGLTKVTLWLRSGDSGVRLQNHAPCLRDGCASLSIFSDDPEPEAFVKCQSPRVVEVDVEFDEPDAGSVCDGDRTGQHGGTDTARAVSGIDAHERNIQASRKVARYKRSVDERMPYEEQHRPGTEIQRDPCQPCAAALP